MISLPIIFEDAGWFIQLMWFNSSSFDDATALALAAPHATFRNSAPATRTD
jgi:uncharacterized membrane protein YhfC